MKMNNGLYWFNYKKDEYELLDEGDGVLDIYRHDCVYMRGGRD